ncbi:hypothetical protein L7F22_036811 [Adiantum nelumboides]|nr:hypothetical protein [Adiantum nelumboides]
MADEGKLKTEKFNGNNYQHWKMQIEDYLYNKDLYLPLDGFQSKPATMTYKAWKVLDCKALGTIRLILASSVAFNIAEQTTTVELMATLDALHEKLSASNKVFLMKRLFNLKMAKNGSVAKHLNQFNTSISQLRSVGMSFDDKVLALLILSSLSNTWDSLVMAVSNAVSSSSALKFDDVVGALLSKEMQRKSTG